MAHISFPNVIQFPKRPLYSADGQALDVQPPPALRVGIAIADNLCICCGAPTEAHFDGRGRHQGCQFAVRHVGRKA